MSDGLTTLMGLQSEIVRAAQAQLDLHARALQAAHDGLKAQAMANQQARLGLKMWNDWLQLWSPPR